LADVNIGSADVIIGLTGVFIGLTVAFIGLADVMIGLADASVLAFFVCYGLLFICELWLNVGVGKGYDAFWPFY